MVDGSIKGTSVWGFMCPDCVVFCGEGIGWGTGQLYLKDESGWLLVGGFDEEDEE